MMEVSNKVDIIYKKLTEKELDTFIQMRINQLREEGATEDIDLTPALKDYYKSHMFDGTFVSWLALLVETVGKKIYMHKKQIYQLLFLHILECFFHFGDLI